MTDVLIIGGGAAGFFAAINCAEMNPSLRVMIVERGKNVLEKVRISGGGRCNVTHACFDPKQLIQYYPRGSKELLSPFYEFSPTNTIEWFAQRGVRLKTEADGRMFPTTDNSETIVDCLWKSAQKAGVQVVTGTKVDKINRSGEHWQITLNKTNLLKTKHLVITTGSNHAIWDLLKNDLGHTIVPPVPSLFTFNIKDAQLHDLLGIAVPNAFVSIENTTLQAQGALLITHWGVSGPAILRLSAWGARQLHEVNYHFAIIVNWLGEKPENIAALLHNCKKNTPKRQVSSNTMFNLPSRLWQYFTHKAEIMPTANWADMSNKHIQNLVIQLTQNRFEVKGKSAFKEEFVTAGGILLKEINFKRFESKIHENLFFAGEVLDIDAITGGFNFQAAWTGGWIIARAISKFNN